ncbi:SepM family pheromone-processing serine protease [Paenibacillus radicis (ex Xue et al. 2023)]|uniref:endopeptidase La n=1 Tax=Paenibacillus radicis (ex Xue et al. 2023) TaxID=2972489 RepID=A0ABT1YCD7_9BACL|nr:SepM family pheromone-processing serine protease [Paenibacillus radicis (ex Xue et al. 2023)]MCR8630858.1 PDZ domain-containing protein [Paenibacillus radicis (ex Xue et al. 2023)]
MGEAREMKRASRIIVSVFIAIALVYGVYFMPLPLFIFSAGTAETIQPMVHTKPNGSEKRGAFMLTTVRVSDASVFGYLMSFVHPYDELRRKTELLRDNESEQEYTQRQEVSMLTSQSSAIQAAYHMLGIPYHISNDGVVIMQIYKDFPAAEILVAGDYIVKVDDNPIQLSEDLQKQLKGKKAGDTVTIAYKRKNVTRTAQIKLAQLPLEKGAAPVKEEDRRVGLGVVPANVQSVKANNGDKQVTIKAGEIGGPSAGLMFSLEIVNRLSVDDISKGYKIAGTGTIDDKGNVGVIGGIQHKIIAADQAGAEIFFAPKDYTSPKGEKIPNYSDAVKRAKDINTTMKIVPVGNMDDALQYLKTLPEKPVKAG